MASLIPPPATHGAGLMLALAGIVAAVLRATMLPVLPKILPVALVALALGVIAIGTVRRWRWHLRRMRGRR